MAGSLASAAIEACSLALWGCRPSKRNPAKQKHMGQSKGGGQGDGMAKKTKLNIILENPSLQFEEWKAQLVNEIIDERGYTIEIMSRLDEKLERAARHLQKDEYMEQREKIEILRNKIAFCNVLIDFIKAE